MSKIMSAKTLMLNNSDQLDLELADICGQFYDDPLGWVMWAFDWGVGELEGFDGPDVWQCEMLNSIGRQVRERCFDGITPCEPIREATSSGHGIGKSAESSWIILWIMSTRPMAKGIVTANTVDQLKTKTWGELGKWRARCIVGHWFEYNNGRGSMSLYHRDHPETWRADAQTCREENSEAFAGLHAADSTPFYLFDEASAVPDAIWEVAEGGLTDGEPMFFVFGNMTRNTGRFHMCFGRQAHRWNTRQIDSRTAKMTNKKLIQQWIDDFGEDSDFVRVRVRGMAPRGGDIQLIPSDIVFAAMKREAGVYLPSNPLICGVDLARGGDDECRIQFRRGKDAMSHKSYRILGERSRDSMHVVSVMTTVFADHKPDIIFVDETGLGGPIKDRFVQLGWPAIGIHFGGKALDEKKYKNRSAEMWWKMREWLQQGGSIPDDPVLETQLTTREYGHNGSDQLVIERKEDMKARGVQSPDWADALALTFAQPVAELSVERSDKDAAIGVNNTAPLGGADYNPLDGL